MLGKTGKDEREPRDRAGFSVRDVVAAYQRAAPELAPCYEGLPFKKVHDPVFDLIPKSGVCVLDVGAGSGRDAAWFADRENNTVFAVEPATRLRTGADGRLRHASPQIRWLDDSLPGLDKVVRSRATFDLIWLSGVWTHIPPGDRTRAFRKLVSLMRPAGRMMISVRRGPAPPCRPMAPASAAEVEKLARRHGLQTVLSERSDDALGRPGVFWEVLWLQLPDDGTGALPLLRHVVFRDQKSSTYKPALLRTLIRIANGASGFARPDGDKRIKLPIGLVALFWVRTFQPLIAAGLPQQPAGNKRLRFVQDGFRRLQGRSPYDLSVGRRFSGQDAQNLIRALRDAANTIRRMPATHITYPGSDTPIFRCSRGKPVRLRDYVLQIDEPFLWSFGSLSVPVHLWQAMSRYAPWIEPAVLGEWVEIMRGYENERKSWDTHLAALKWLEPEHDTSDVRSRVEQLRSRGGALYCVWTGKRLKSRIDIDHCLPFAA